MSSRITDSRAFYKPEYRKFYLGFCPILIFAAFLSLLYGISLFIRNFNTLKWPHTSGKITISEMSGPDLNHRSEYFTTIHYDYTINGRVYSNDEIGRSYAYVKSVQLATSILEKYPVGRRVAVYYDPSDIGNTVLEPGFSVDSFIPLMIGIPGILVMSVLLRKAYKDTKTLAPKSNEMP